MLHTRRAKIPNEASIHLHANFTTSTVKFLSFSPPALTAPWDSAATVLFLPSAAKDEAYAMRSRTGCQTCRQRKLKCDEQKPSCGQCAKGSRDCVPSDGVIFRHQQNASMNGTEESGTNQENRGRLEGFYAYKNTFDENNIWVEVPKNVTFYNIEDPYNMELSPEPQTEPELESEQLPETTTSYAREVDDGAAAEGYFRLPFEAAPGLEALSTAAASNYNYMQPLSVPALSPNAISIFSPSSSNNLDFILNPTRTEKGSPQKEPVFRSPSANRQQSSVPVPQPVIDHEVAFLLRHFSETAGQWMDLFDLDCYFARMVPLQGLSNPLLLSAACAYAAKQLSRVQGRKATIGGIVEVPANMELHPNAKKTDWMFISAKYYDSAIQLLMVELSSSRLPDTPLLPIQENLFTPQSVSHSPQSATSTHSQSNKRRRLSRPVQTSNADQTFAAATILCVYEFLDNAKNAWDRHLSGTKSLFDLADKEQMLPIQSPASPGSSLQRLKPSEGRKATFWCFARQDFVAAFINETQTRLNTADLSLWRAAGLHLDENGFVISSNPDEANYSELEPDMREDMISNALIWLLSKIINYVASGDSIDHVFPQNLASPNGTIGINQMVLLQRWRELDKELDVWHSGLPDTFKPCARLPRISDGSVPIDSPRAVFSEIWYSIPMCASTMQSYHMAKIILLLNKPQESTARRSTISHRLGSYRSTEQEVQYHSREICGIALGRPEGSVRIHQVQPLFVSGSCLIDDRERRIILDLLRGIETDLGWATDYRVKDLLNDWGWESNQL